MKVYDTDEAAVAKYARQKLLVKVLTVALMLFMSGFGIFIMMKFFGGDGGGDASAPRTVASVSYGLPGSQGIAALDPGGVPLWHSLLAPAA